MEPKNKKAPSTLIKKIGKVVAPIAMTGFVGGAGAIFVGTLVSIFFPPLGLAIVGGGLIAVKAGGATYLAAKVARPIQSLIAASKKGGRAFAAVALRQTRNLVKTSGKLGFYGGLAVFLAGAGVSLFAGPLAAMLMVPGLIAMKAGAAAYLTAKLGPPIIRIAASIRHGPKVFARNAAKGMVSFFTNAAKIAGKNAIGVGIVAAVVGTLASIPFTGGVITMGLAGVATTVLGATPAFMGMAGLAAGAAAIVAKSAFILAGVSIAGGLISRYGIGKIGDKILSKFKSSKNQQQQNDASVDKSRSNKNELSKNQQLSRGVSQGGAGLQPEIQRSWDQFPSPFLSTSVPGKNKIETDEAGAVLGGKPQQILQPVSHNPKLDPYSSKPLEDWATSNAYQQTFTTKSDNPGVHYLKNSDKPAFAEQNGRINVMSTDDKTVKSLLNTLAERGVHGIRIEDATVKEARAFLKNKTDKMEILPSEKFKEALRDGDGKSLVTHREAMIALYSDYIKNTDSRGDINDKQSIAKYLESRLGKKMIQKYQNKFDNVASAGKVKSAANDNHFRRK